MLTKVYFVVAFALLLSWWLALAYGVFLVVGG